MSIISFRDSEGNLQVVTPEDPLPVTCCEDAPFVSHMHAEQPLQWDQESTTMSIQQNVAGGVPTLDQNGKIRNTQLPPLQPDVGYAADETEMLALDVSAPAMAVRDDTDPPHLYMLTEDPATDINNWHNMGSFATAGQDPSAQVGLDPTNGSSSFYMRADASPALDQSISPTWSGAHTFTSDVTHEASVDMSANQINNMADGTEPQDAVTVSQLNAAVATPAPGAANPLIPAVLAYKTQDQNIVNGAARTLTWQATAYDPHGMLINSTDFVVPEWAAFARVTVKVSYATDGTATDMRLVYVGRNGSFDFPGAGWVELMQPSGGFRGTPHMTSGIFPVNAGDVITGATRQYASSDRTVSGRANGDLTWMQIELCPA